MVAPNEEARAVSKQHAVAGLYRQLIDGWNASDADAMAAVVASDGLVVGFDGSQMRGPEEVAAELGGVFADHETAKYVTKVRSITPLGRDAALLHAVAGMVPPGGGKIVPERNAIQTIVGRRDDAGWSVALFHTTPARFDGRPDLAGALTAELAGLVAERAGDSSSGRNLGAK
jgi:uncharacterized protein (TIGR02246 family)